LQSRAKIFDEINLSRLEHLFVPKRYGRRPYNRLSIISGLIVMYLCNKRTFRDLTAFLEHDRFWSRKCGFMGSVPHYSTFYRVFAAIDDKKWVEINQALVYELIRLGVISAKDWVIDSSIIEAIDSDPEARWGYKDEDTPLYGYKVHLICCAESELPLSVIVTPANESDFPHCIPLLCQTVYQHYIAPKSLIADKGYDSREIRDFIQTFLSAKPIIPNRDYIGINIEYSKSWKKLYNKRTSVERIFDRIKNIANLRKFHIKGLRNVTRITNIVCIGMLVVALVAYYTNKLSNFRKIKWFRRALWE
jgi:transposase